MKKFFNILIFSFKFYRCFNCSLKDNCPRSMFFTHEGEKYSIVVKKEV